MRMLENRGMRERRMPKKRNTPVRTSEADTVSNQGTLVPIAEQKAYERHRYQVSPRDPTIPLSFTETYLVSESSRRTPRDPSLG